MGDELSSCVLTMRSSSPSQKRPDSEASKSESSFTADYSKWRQSYPSALESFRAVVGAQISNLEIFLDYDGTLTDIVPDPERAILSPETQDALERVSRHFPTSIVTGRSLEKIHRFVPLDGLKFAGSHGMDLELPGAPEKLKKIPPMIAQVERTLNEKLKTIEGKKLENNKFSLSIHYRHVKEDMYKDIASCVLAIVRDYPELKIAHGRKVLEVRPKFEWNKGSAVEFMRGKKSIPVFIGDDVTDEDAFKSFNRMKLGYGIVVSTYAKKTDAQFSLQNPREVREFLSELVLWKEEEDQ
ncbi:hypothetical protein ACFE04_029999 [Oxalis oulophora]